MWVIYKPADWEAFALFFLLRLMIQISCITLRTLDFGNYGIFLIMQGNAGFISSAVVPHRAKQANLLFKTYSQPEVLRVSWCLSEL